MQENKDVVENKEEVSKKKLPKFVIPSIIAAVVLIAAVVVAVILLNKPEANSGTNTASGSNTSSGSNSSSSSSSENNYSPSELEKNVVTSGAVTKRGKLVAFVTNNNEVAVDMEIEVEFYDSNNVIVGSDEAHMYAVGAGAEIATELWDTPDSWDNYKIYVDLEQADYQSYLDKISINHSQTKDNIAVQVTNNSEDTIDYMSVSVVYYQGEEVVGFNNNSASEVKPGRSGNFNLSFPYDKNYKTLRFDSYKVFVNSAYSYNW